MVFGPVKKNLLSKLIHYCLLIMVKKGKKMCQTKLVSARSEKKPHNESMFGSGVLRNVVWWQSTIFLSEGLRKFEQ